jgi:Fcf2 pre-rRNA processing
MNKDDTKSCTARSNELTRLIPGYTAPFRLDSGIGTKSSLSLDEWTRRARRNEAAKATQTMSQLTKGSVSFKTGKSVTTPSAAAPIVTTTTAGAAWFDMRPTEMTDELKYDVAVIRNRSALDPKRFYKSMDWKKKQGSSPMIQVGTVIEGSSEFYSSRLTQAQRRTNVTDELLANGDAAYAQAKFKRMQQAKTVLAQKRRRTPSKKTSSLHKSGKR